MNIIAISGRLTRDPELKYTKASGKAVASFTLAVSRPGVKDTTDFLRCVAWDKKAEFVSRYFRQGQRMEVSGIITTRQYEKDGSNRTVTEIRCDQVFFGDNKKAEAMDETEKPTAMPEITELTDDDDGQLPF